MRPIQDHEKPLIRYLLDRAGFDANLNEITVQNLDDGGMGSLVFGESVDGRELAEVVAECSFLDSDGIEVSVTLSVASDGSLYELDIWKVDFSPLGKWPNRQDLEGAA